MRKTLRRWHLWLGWLVGVPMLLWTLSGLIMVLKPIEEVRGEHLLRPATPIELRGAPLVLPPVPDLPIESMTLEARAAGPRWVIRLENGDTRLADTLTGAILPAYGAADAAREVESRYLGDATIAQVIAVDPEHPPLDWRRKRAAWAVEMSDGTRFYVERDSGAIAARRTGWWRIYDFFWGLHIMDLQTREDSSNGFLKAFAAFSLVTVVLALVLLPLSTGRKRR